MKVVLKVIPIIYALCVTFLVYQSSTWVGGLIEEPVMSEMILSAVKILCFISAYVLYFLSLKGKLGFKYCYLALLLHSGLVII